MKSRRKCHQCGDQLKRQVDVGAGKLTKAQGVRGFFCTTACHQLWTTDTKVFVLHRRNRRREAILEQRARGHYDVQ